MSQKNVERLRWVYAEWAKGNFSAGGELLADDVVFAPFVERRTVRGMASVNAYMREFLAQWSEFRVEAQELIGTGDSIVVAERQRGKGVSSGIETDKAALNAAGLSE